MKHLFFIVLIPALMIRCASGDSEKQRNAKPVNIEFYETYTLEELQNSWVLAIDLINENDSLKSKGIDLTSLLNFQSQNSIGFVKPQNVEKLNAVLALPEITSLFPKDLKFMFSHKPEKIPGRSEFYVLYAIKIPEDGKPRVSGLHIKKAEYILNESMNDPMVSITMTNIGSRRWMKMTQDNIGKAIAITMDGKVLSCPVVRDAITGGSTEISGDFTVEEAEDLAMGINAGH